MYRKPLLPRDFAAYLRGLNLWTLKQKIKDHTIQKTSTIQLLQKIDIYQLSDVDRAKLIEIADAKEQQVFLKTHGVLKRTTGEMKSHSFVLQFLQHIEVIFAHLASVAPDFVYVLDSTNTSRTLYTIANSTLALEAPATNEYYGILVGTGVTAPANTDYTMQTKVAHGSTANKLQYGACAVNAAGIVGANVDLVITRIFINGSGGAITLREIGLANYYTATLYFLFTHDAVNQAIANTEVALVSYDFRTTV